MMQTIKANRLFALIPERQSRDRIVQMKIPIRRIADQPDYSLKLLELMVLIACIRITGAKRMFEFGTFLGNTTLHMALNSDPDAEIWTLDADDETLERLGFMETYRWRGQFPLEFAGTSAEDKIHALRGDSHNFDVGQLAESMDLILVDGDHTAAGVGIDTQNAFRLRRPGHRTCILWHDYDPSDEDCRDIVAALDKEISPLIHIEDTKLVILLQ